MKDVFVYPKDKKEVKRLIDLTKHIALIKAMLKFLSENKDKDVPKIIFGLVGQKFTSGFRASMILLCEEYDCKAYFLEFIKLVVKDSYNTALYANDILVKYTEIVDDSELKRAIGMLSKQVELEKVRDKAILQKRLIKFLNKEVSRRKNTGRKPTSITVQSRHRCGINNIRIL
jgi:hypothetical protein